MQMSKLGAFVFLLVCSFTSIGQVLESSVVLTSAPRLSLEIESTDTISLPLQMISPSFSIDLLCLVAGREGLG